MNPVVSSGFGASRWTSSFAASSSETCPTIAQRTMSPRIEGSNGGRSRGGVTSASPASVHGIASDTSTGGAAGAASGAGAASTGGRMQPAAPRKTPTANARTIGPKNDTARPARAPTTRGLAPASPSLGLCARPPPLYAWWQGFRHMRNSFLLLVALGTAGSLAAAACGDSVTSTTGSTLVEAQARAEATSTSSTGGSSHDCRPRRRAAKAAPPTRR